MRHFKTLFSLFFSLSIIPVLTQASQAETYQGIDFPPGEVYFAQKASCSLTESVFTAMGSPNYSMVFEPSSAGFASVPYTVTIGHTQRGPIDLFDYSVSLGYPSSSLNLRKDQDQATPRSFSIYFFDANLHPTYDGEQATYAFIDGLGAYDYYNNVDTGSRTNTMGSVMWKRSCS